MWSNRFRQKDSTTDLLKQIKNNYSSPKVEEYECKKVAKRTTDTFMLEWGDHVWEENFARFKSNMEKGHFCPKSIPYVPLGNIELDSGELTLQGLANGLPNKILENYRKKHKTVTPSHQQSAGTPTTDKEKRETSPSSQQEPEAEDCINRNDLNSAGMTDIKAMLEESRKRIIAVKAGQPYNHHVTACQKEKQLQLQKNNKSEENYNMEVKRLSSCYLASDIGTAGIDLEASNKQPKNMASSKGIALYQIPALKSAGGKMYSNVQRNTRRLHSYLSKLECLHTIMVSLLNMKSKHLRTRLPLTLNVVKALRNSNIASNYDRRMSIMRRRTSRHRETHDNFSRVDHRTGQSFAKPSIKTASSSNKDSAETGSAGLVKKSSEATDSTKGQSAAKLFRRKTRNILSMMEHRVETWEDLMLAGNKAAKTLKALSHRKHPPWTPHWSEQKTAIIAREPQSESSTGEIEKDSSFVLQMFKNDLQELKHELRKETLNSLAKQERERIIKFQRVLSAFEDLHPLWEHQVKVLKNVQDDITFDPDLILKDENVTWFDCLLEEAKTLNLKQDDVLDDVLHKVERLCRYDFSIIPHGREKLCLLVMSMPAYEICEIQMQSALIFVLKDVLQLNPNLLTQWLQIRGLSKIQGA